jgi:hypothetical protein
MSKSSYKTQDMESAKRIRESSLDFLESSRKRMVSTSMALDLDFISASKFVSSLEVILMLSLSSVLGLSSSLNS